MSRPDNGPTDGGDEREESLGWRGWVVVAALVGALIVAPWALILVPGIQDGAGALGLGYRDTYLVLPLLPALGLGALGVWAAVASRREE